MSPDAARALADLPPGFAYLPGFIAEDDERALLVRLRAVAYADIVMRGQLARRRTAHFGWRYGYETWRIEPGPPVPDWVLPLRERAAALVGVTADALAEVLLTEYAPGAGIGWHRDAPMFGAVIGVSLGAPCRFRLTPSTPRKDTGERGRVRDTRTVVLEPRSAYVLDGEVRWRWRHSIPPMKATRYSITFRTLRRR